MCVKPMPDPTAVHGRLQSKINCREPGDLLGALRRSLGCTRCAALNSMTSWDNGAINPRVQESFAELVEQSPLVNGLPCCPAALRERSGSAKLRLRVTCSVAGRGRDRARSSRLRMGARCRHRTSHLRKCARQNPARADAGEWEGEGIRLPVLELASSKAPGPRKAGGVFRSDPRTA